MFILLGFFSDPKFRPRQIALGQLLGITTLYAVSVAASLLSLVVPPAFIGFLGLLPIGIGLKKMWELHRKDDFDDGERKERRSRWNVLTDAAVTVSDGGDNLSVYIHVFAWRNPSARTSVRRPFGFALLPNHPNRAE